MVKQEQTEKVINIIKDYKSSSNKDLISIKYEAEAINICAFRCRFKSSGEITGVSKKKVPALF